MNWMRNDPGSLSPRGVVCVYERARGRYIREYPGSRFVIVEVGKGEERKEVAALGSLEEAKALVDTLDALNPKKRAT